ncbi:MAG: PilC/PilY family type IV pilus protein [Gammaproteobacteria bacterium]
MRAASDRAVEAMNTLQEPMSMLVQTSSLRSGALKALWASLAAVLLVTSAQSANLNLQDVPLYLLSRADPNVLLEMSVETPMGGAAYTDQTGVPAGCAGRRNDVLGDGAADDIGSCYFTASTYLGYFDPKKCYTYSGSQFNPAGPASADHSCTSQWSGNFLNWATMTAIDMFTWTMTGGNRIVDTTSSTVIRRARKENNNSWFPRKVLNSGINVAPSTVTPFADSTVFVHNTSYGFNIGSNFAAATSGSGGGFLGSFNVSVKVCDATAGNETNCVPYGSTAYYKPEGLIQNNASVKRFAVTSYTFDNTPERDGGVLRSNMKYVGPKLPDGTANTKKEYGTDGLLIDNPDGASGGLNSGVINYINKFSDPGYKSYDPIGELFYESVRFFKHLPPTPEYSSGLSTAQCGGFQVLTTWQDPIQYRCQKNFIIAINDANPWLDKKLPGTYFTSSTLAGAPGFNPFALASGDYGQPSNADPDIDVRALTNKVGDLEGLNGTTWTESGTWTSGAQSGVNDSVGGGSGTWDNSCSDKTVGALGEVMGTCPYPGKQNSYYVAGLAYYANTTDLRTDFPNDRGIQNVASFVIDTQEFQSNPLDGPKNMLWLAGKYGGFVDKNDDKVPQTSEWDADGDGAPDNYVLATKPDKLVAGLNRAFDFIDSQTSSASSASVNAGSISSDTRVYQALFNSADWTGQLLAKPVLTDGSGQLGTLQWDAETLVPSSGSRTIITRNANTNTGVAFRWADIGAIRQGQLDPTSDTNGDERLDYLRGDTALEKPSGSFRKRAKKLGDIINSEPVFVGKPPFLYPTTSYVAYRNAQAARTQMVYVGGNDGMLHGFNAATGVEKLAFVPGAVFRNLIDLTQQNYGHRFYVDGSPTMGDAFYNSDWHTVLVGGLNKGGQGIYALDITTPATFSESNASSIYRWEFTDADDADLGFTFSRPAIVQMHNGKWAAVFGNGYNNTTDDTASGGQKSSTGQAALYIVDIETGALIRKISTNVGTADDPWAQSRPNGLATPALADIDGDSVVDFAFAGDLFGHLWKFDLSDTDPTNWAIAFSGAPLFNAVDASNKAQPITTRPEVGRGPNGRGMIVLFGTGKFLESTDKDIAQLSTQTFYGIIDPNTAIATVVTGRNKLTQQTITFEDTVDFDGNSVPIRVTSTNAVPANMRGWYLDLLSGAPGVPPPAGFKGEMQVSDPVLRNGRIIFTTLIPTPDPCAFGGTSWLMEVSALSGARLPYAPLDLNDDGKFDMGDFVTLSDGTKVAVSGMRSDVGITAKPGVLADGNAEFKYMSGTKSRATGGNMQVVRENPGVGDVGRQSWRQLR